MKRRMTMKPVLLIELLLVAMLVGVGVAYALTVNPMTGSDYWLGGDTVADSNVSVVSYDFVWNSSTEVTAVSLNIANGDAVGHTYDVSVAVGDGIVDETGSQLGLTIAASDPGDTVVVTLSAPVPAANVVNVSVQIEVTA